MKSEETKLCPATTKDGSLCTRVCADGCGHCWQHCEGCKLDRKWEK